MKRFAFLSLAAICAFDFVSCNFDQTPADIHDELVPVIAEDLVRKQNSEHLVGLSSQAQNILFFYATKGMRYEVNPMVPADAGISFYSEGMDKPFLEVGLMLRVDRRSYKVYECRIYSEHEQN